MSRSTQYTKSTKENLGLELGDLLVTQEGIISGGGGDGDGVIFHVGCGFEPASSLDDIFSVFDVVDAKLKYTASNVPREILSRGCPFYLRVETGPTSNSDWAAWVSAYIARP